MSMRRLVMGLTLVVVGMLMPVAEASALTKISGNVYCYDGVTPLVMGDRFTVVATASDGSKDAFKITYPTVSSYKIMVDDTLLPADDKSITLDFKLGDTIDRHLEGINGAAKGNLSIDIGMSKAGAAPVPAAQTITGDLFEKNGAKIIANAFSYSVVAMDANNNTYEAVIDRNTFTLTIPAITGNNQTLTLYYYLNGQIDRYAEGILAITGSFDISHSKAVP